MDVHEGLFIEWRLQPKPSRQGCYAPDMASASESSPTV